MKKITRPWTPAEDEAIRRHYPNMATKELAEMLRRTERTLYHRAATLGVRKSEEFLRNSAGRFDGERGKAHRFAKGFTPWNKGKKGSTGHHPNTQRTQFKRGELRGAAVHNYVPIGTLRITKDGVLERKVSDDQNVYPARRWVSVQRLVWEAEHGPIPDGHVVAFKPGTQTTVEAEITIDKLELISRSELMARNTRHRLPKPLADLIALRGALTRKLNKINKEDTHER